MKGKQYAKSARLVNIRMKKGKQYAKSARLVNIRMKKGKQYAKSARLVNIRMEKGNQYAKAALQERTTVTPMLLETPNTIMLQQIAVCSSGQYQHQTQQTTCIDCPAGTVRYSNTVDGTSWNGATNNDIANTKADCKVCPSGRYQNEAGTADCNHCPAGTMRAADEKG